MCTITRIRKLSLISELVARTAITATLRYSWRVKTKLNNKSTTVPQIQSCSMEITMLASFSGKPLQLISQFQNLWEAVTRSSSLTWLGCKSERWMEILPQSSMTMSVFWASRILRHRVKVLRLEPRYRTASHLSRYFFAIANYCPSLRTKQQPLQVDRPNGFNITKGNSTHSPLNVWYLVHFKGTRKGQMQGALQSGFQARQATATRRKLDVSQRSMDKTQGTQVELNVWKIDKMITQSKAIFKAPWKQGLYRWDGCM